MTSRRPMTRSFSGNGRTSSFSEEESSSSNGRNTYLSNVRPENRSTLCTVMAQLTEDVQPSFETTLKSKAVSENCNVKFTCVVTGYPAPELKWYKDDMEMDRYCGLPKYEIRRNGKTHTLHIYNCTLDDAAIYQVSASNSKGIVSCSGVLEVGTMSEYQIHQRFFAKLKAKAEKKKSDLEEQSKKDKGGSGQVKKETVAQQSPERTQRKRAIPQPNLSAEEPLAGGAGKESQNTAQEPVPPSLATSAASEVKKDNEPDLAKKKIKISNGMDPQPEQPSTPSSASSRNQTMGNGGDNHYDGGMGLAQFLAETLQSQAAEEKQVSNNEEAAASMESMENVHEEKKEEEMEHDTIQEKTDQHVKEEKKEKSHPTPPSRHEVKLHTKKELKEQNKEHKEHKEHKDHREHKEHKEHKDHREHKEHKEYKDHREQKEHKEYKDHREHKEHKDHHIPASLSSMLHSVKDFFFGKNKRDIHERQEHKEKDASDSSSVTEQSPPSFYLQGEDEMLAESTGKSPQEREDSCRAEGALEGLAPAGSGADQAMEFTAAKEAPLSSAQLPTEMGRKDEQLLESSVCVSDAIMDVAEHSLKEASSLHSERFTANSQLGVEQAHSRPFQRLHTQGTSEDSPDTSPRPEETSVHNSVFECHPTQNTQHIHDLAVPLEMEKTLSSASGPVLSEDMKENKENIFCPPVQEMKLGPPSVVADGVRSAQRQSVSEWNMSVSANEAQGIRIDEVPGQSMEIQIPLEMIPAIQISASEQTQANEAVSQMDISFTEDSNKSLQNDRVLTSFEHDISALPDIKICSTEDFPEIQVAVPIICVEDEILTPAVEVSRPDVEEGPSFITHLPQEMESDISQREFGNWSNVIIQNEFVSDFCTPQDQESMTQVQEPLQIHYPIPIINVSCTEETMGQASDVIPFLETAPLPLLTLPVTDTLGQTPEHRDVPERVKMTEDTLQIEHTETVISKETLEHVKPLELREETRENRVRPERRELTECGDIPDHSETAEQRKAFEHREEAPTEHKDRAESEHKDKAESELKDRAESELKDKAESERKDRAEGELKDRAESERKDKAEGELKDRAESELKDRAESERKDKAEGELKDRAESELKDRAESELKDRAESELKDRAESELKDKAESELKDKAESELKDRAESELIDNDVATRAETQSEDRQIQGEQLEQNLVENKLTVACEVPQSNANVLSKSVVDSIESEITQSLKEARIESFMSVERLSFKPPLYPSLSPASLRKFMLKTSTDPDNATDRQSDKAEDSLSGGSTPTSSLSCESSPRLKRRDSLSLIRSATPEELASGARRKIFIPKTKEETEDNSSKKDSPYMSPGQTRRGAFLQPPSGQNTPPVERRSPLLNRRKATLEVPKVVEEIPVPEEFSAKEEKSGDKKPDPLKAPQVIRKIRGEPFPDASGHLKLWCQFFNVLSDSTIKWYKDEQEILEVQRSGGDESQVALAIVLASSLDCAVYGCTINNEYGSDTTDFLLSEDVMGEILLKDDLEVGEEIEMTPLMFNRGLADSGSWTGKFFGRVMTETVHLGEGWAHKTSRAKVIYGLEPVFESGSSCIMKVQSPIPYGTKLESNLAERNQEITKQECKVQNMVREYCKIFAAEARVSDNFGSGLEVLSQYLMYRPANSVPYATVELDLEGSFQTYCWVDAAGKLNSKGISEAEQKCCTLQHWLHEWTHSNLLLTRLEGVDFKLTNIRVATKSKGYQGLSERGSPALFDQFLTHHQCNYYCGLLGLRPLKSMDSLQTPSKIKGSRSPLANRKLSIGSGSPQVQKKASLSPHAQRKAGSSPKAPRKSQDSENSNSAEKTRAVDSR